MRTQAPFQADDLTELGELYEQATSVVPMEDVADGLTDASMIALRHDCDNVILPAVAMAEWEEERGIRSTYYVLHHSAYWQDKPTLRWALDRIASLGHNLGIHNDAITVALETGRDPAFILNDAAEELRRYGHTIRSTVAHGNARCHIDQYVNDQMFDSCFRPDYGDISRLGFTTTPLEQLGLEFDANWLPRGMYLSDSGGRWSRPFEMVADRRTWDGQLHMLVHPDWWAEAFVPAEVAA